MAKKKIVYVDMDNVLVDFPSGIAKLSQDLRLKYKDDPDEVPGIFSLMEPMPNAIESFNRLSQHFDTYILSTAPWLNHSAWSDKLLWVQRHFGIGSETEAYKRLIISHHKNLNKGDYLIDDRINNGADKFEGELLLFGSDEFPDWHSVIRYLIPNT